MTSSNSPIVVIGAGVIGLSTAVTLQTRFPGRNIIIVANEFPSLIGTGNASASYASAWAGAHYRPIYPSTPQLQREATLARRTFSTMRQIERWTPEAGVGIMKGVEYFDKVPENGMERMKNGDAYAGEDDFRVLPTEELIDGVGYGCEYTTYGLNTPKYCQYLMKKFTDDGGRIETVKIERAEQIFDLQPLNADGRIKLVANCSGANFGVDPLVKMIRGQTCLVRNEYHRTVTRQYPDGRWAAIIPRPHGGGTIVGVSKDIGDDEVNPRPETRELLLKQSLETCPDFVSKIEDFDVIGDNVGRRPFREGGLRIEVEKFGDNRSVIHGYGAGGRGYELSWGVAEEVADLVGAEDRR